MIALTIRTDNPEAEVGLYDKGKQLTHKKWLAHRQLAETIHTTIEEVLESQGLTWDAIDAIVVYEGPGSFTGLRIGMTVANTLAFDLQIPIIATKGDQWVAQGIQRIIAGEQDEIALPFYGAEANITIPRK